MADGRLWRSPKASGALHVATKKFQIAIFPHDFGAHDDAVDALSQRRICPFDRGNVASPPVEQDRCNFAVACPFLLAVQRAHEEHQPCALYARELRTGWQRG